jgi:hypothetical protein
MIQEGKTFRKRNKKIFNFQILKLGRAEASGERGIRKFLIFKIKFMRRSWNKKIFNFQILKFGKRQSFWQKKED